MTEVFISLDREILKLGGAIWTIIHLFEQNSLDEAEAKNVRHQDKGLDGRDKD